MKKRPFYSAMTTIYVLSSIILLYATIAIHIGLVFPLVISMVSGLWYGERYEHYVRIDNQLTLLSNEMYEGTGND